MLWGIVGAGMMLDLDWLFTILIGGLAFLALFECLKMFGASEDRRYRNWTVLMGAAYLVAVFHHVNTQAPPSRAHFAHLDLFFLVLLIVGLFTLTLTRPLEGRATLHRLLGSFFSFFYAIVLFLFVARVIYLPAQNGVYYALYLLAVTKFTDMGAYAIGSLWGKNKMIPHISPGKTWEGFGGAFLGAYVASAIIYFPLRGHFTHLDFIDALILPLILGLAAVVGDLAESVLKRCLETKDSGHVLPGIGGSLDLIDSLCFTAPVLYLYLNHVKLLAVS